MILSYFIIFFINKNRFITNSNLISHNNRIRQKIISESLGNMRETIMFSAQEFFLKLFNKSNSIISYSIANNQYLSSIPRFIIEIIVFIIIIFFIFIMKTNASLEENLPMFGIYLVAGYKLLPALQAIANSYSSIKGNNSALINIKSDLNNILHNNKNTLIGKKKIQENFSNIELKNIYFSHKEKVIFKNLNFKINKSEVVGIMGETGSGKSTFIDIFCGLLSFKNGIYLYNEKEIHLNNKFGLENKVALVPQKINLLDDSIKNNIFFSKDENNEKLSYLKDICILNFVEEKNRNWNTIVGENGSKLSGGQIQRLGIARALFNEPAILILDEATSGLDKDTEKQLINNLLKFRPKLTLIIISHNKDLLKFCDRIYELEDYKLAQINQ